MSRPERQQNVLDLLKQLRGIEPLKQLFWSELNYQRVNQPLSRRGWTESASKALADDSVLFAGGGENNAFHVIYGRLASDGLARGAERPVVTQLLREHPYALFVFSNKSQTDWHFLNVKFDEKAERRRLFRRITVRPGAGLRTATERLQLLDLTEIHPELFGITPLAIQQRCDTAFDVKTVTEDFFREIANWYFWALKHARFPKDAPKEADGHDHISIIRLITRLIFCWFVKEKGLVPGELFDERHLSRMLAGFAPDKSSEKESVFYKAILQNLFFATLNTEMDKRGWTKEEQNFMAHSLYRHRELFRESADALDLFKNIPFLNGGLFECLDKDLGENAKPRYIRIDGFSRRDDSQPVVPDFLFFGGEREVDLSEDYGDKKFKRVPVRGLIHTFNRYNFTVEENTPIEEEVALDPELSGKVFENLLAAYNPETGATARKQTGSFYTPREIVNYMVDEALIACLKTKLESGFGVPASAGSSDAKPPEGGTPNLIEPRLRHLFAYNDEPHQFTPAEVRALITAIDNLKCLDPAVGSGAFPMGILHKLVFILGKLDPRNEQWKERQIARVRDTMATAEKIEDATARECAVRELEQQITGINEAFEHNELDYGRKLYLIENCIYGVDIQPIAVQIAKMRFFISLIVDQKIDDAQPNRGVRPLPNLETKFVAANSLIGVNRPGQQMLRNREIDAKEAELRRVRQRHFDAKTPKQKAKCREQDEKLRAEIAELLKGDGWDTATARKLASWNPYDQNASADFYDSEWMFGIIDGFDVVVGNPPYLASYSRESVGMSEAEKSYFAAHYTSTSGRINTFILFTERSCTLAAKSAHVSFIVPKPFLMMTAYQKTRRLLIKLSLRSVVACREEVFTGACVPTCIFLFQQKQSNPEHVFSIVEYGQEGFAFLRNFPNLQALEDDECRINVTADEGAVEVLKRVSQVSTVLNDFCLVEDGINPGPFREWLVTGKKVSEKCVKLIEGRNFHRYLPITWNGKWFLWDKDAIKIRQKEHPTSIAVLGDPARFLVDSKIVTRQTADGIIATLDEAQCFSTNSVHTTRLRPGASVDLRFVLGILNSSLIRFFFQNQFKEKENAFPQVKVNKLRKIPIPSPPKQEQQGISKRATDVLRTKQKNPAADTSALEREIDQQVYALYGLTPEEIKIVEGSSQ